MKRVLLVEDDLSLGPALKESLKRESFDVVLVQTFEDASKEEFKNYDIILLDWMLPDGQGIDLLKVIKNDAPVIMLTARTDLIDKVIGLESGANDYITKPFEARELIARIRVQLRTKSQTEHSEEKLDELISKDLRFNLEERKIYYQEKEMTFTKMEFDLLYLLVKNPKRVFSREKLLDEVWGYENYPTTRTVDTHVLQIRQKLTNDIIETVRGVGYRYNPDHK